MELKELKAEDLVKLMNSTSTEEKDAILSYYARKEEELLRDQRCKPDDSGIDRMMRV